MPIDSSALFAANMALELEGKVVGFLRSVEGGEPFATVVSGTSTPTGIVPKHRSTVQFAPITIEFGSGMSKEVYQWISATLDRNVIEKSGAIILADMNFSELSRLTFDGALITEIKFPSFDASDKTPASFVVTLQPRSTQASATTAGGKVTLPSAKAQKAWIASNFRFKITGLESACSKVSKVDSLVVKRTITTASVGDTRTGYTVGVLEVPTVTFSVADSMSKDFHAWFDEYVTKGSTVERSATIELLEPDLSSVIFTVNLSNVGITRVRRERLEANAESIARATVEMYCESISLSLAGEAAAPVIAPTTPIKVVGTPPISIRP